MNRLEAWGKHMAETSALEQWLLEMINMARLDPEATALRFGVSLNDGLPPGTISSAPKAVLAMSDILQLSADFHGEYQLQRGSFGTPGHLGSNPGERMAYAGFNDGATFDWAETINWRVAPNPAWVAEDTLLYNMWLDLIRAPDTRAIILGDYNQVGVSFVNGLLGETTDQHGYVITNDYARNDQVFITGGAYQSIFMLDRFDRPADGVAGVKVTSGGVTALSQEAGGYSLAVASGMQAVKVGKVMLSVEIGDENIKIDLVGTDRIRADHSITVTYGARSAELIGIRDADIRLVSNSGTIYLYGNAGDNKLTGNNANNVIYGGAGDDAMHGGAGDDRYTVEDAGDAVYEKVGGGHDTVVTEVSHTLKKGSEVEVLTASPGIFVDPITLRGNEFSQDIHANHGANTLDGGGGGDRLFGSVGNDVYYIRHALDEIWEFAGEGTDSARSAISFKLAVDDSIESLATNNSLGLAAINLTGNDLGQTVAGNAGNNRLSGLGGDDRLEGRAGDDYILGDDGNDRLYGGLGRDRLQGGAGSDRYYFVDAPGEADADMILYFARNQDSIYLDKDAFTGLTGSRLAGSAFKNLALGDMDASDRIIQDGHQLYFDADGSGGAAAQLFAELKNDIALTSADFWLV